MIRVLFSAAESNWQTYEAPLGQAFDDAGLTVDLSTDHPPGDVDWIVYAPSGGLRDFTPFTNAKGVLSLWAGVETIIDNPTLTQPLARMVDPGLTQGMVDYVVGHVMRHHLGLDTHIARTTPDWRPVAPPLSRDRSVVILGLGALGAASAAALAHLGFDVAGWSRSDKAIDGVTCLTGASGLRTALGRAEILVLLLPLTDETESILDAPAIGHLPAGAVVINPGRGALIDDSALLAALETGHVGHATLDTFRVEPLPEDHVFWSHPAVTVTPHIASETRPASAARVIAAQIARGEAGERLHHLVDRDRGY